jgi:hypothetical protein
MLNLSAAQEGSAAILAQLFVVMGSPEIKRCVLIIADLRL